MKNFLSLSLLLPLFLLITRCGDKAPKQNLDSLSFKTRSFNDTLNRIDSLVNAYKVSNKHKAKYYGKLALTIAFQFDSEEMLAHAFLIMGVAYSNQNSDSSYIYYAKSLRIAQSRGFEWIQSKAIYNIAMIYLDAADFNNALIYLDSAISISRKAKDFAMLSNAYNSIGNLKSDLFDTANARVMYDSAYNISLRYKLNRQMGIAMASLSAYESNPDKTEVMRKDAINILGRQPGNEEEIARIYNNIGTQCSHSDTALKYYRASLSIAKSGNCTEVEIATLNNMVYSFIDKKDLVQAKKCLSDRAIPLARKSENDNLLSILYDTYADVMIAEKNTIKAFEFERLSLQLRIKADQRHASDQVRLLGALLDVKNKEIRIEAATKELQQKEFKNRISLALRLS